MANWVIKEAGKDAYYTYYHINYDSTWDSPIPLKEVLSWRAWKTKKVVESVIAETGAPCENYEIVKLASDIRTAQDGEAKDRFGKPIKVGDYYIVSDSHCRAELTKITKIIQSGSNYKLNSNKLASSAITMSADVYKAIVNE